LFGFLTSEFFKNGKRLSESRFVFSGFRHFAGCFCTKGNKKFNREKMEETSNNRDRSPAEDHASSSNKMSIDRVKTCPFLLRCFWKMNKHNIPSDYRNVSRGIFPNQEVQIYTWLNASVKEISELLKNVIQPMQENSHATLSFSAVYVDEKGFFAMRKVHTSLLLAPSLF
jgi:hypothetical protein